MIIQRATRTLVGADDCMDRMTALDGAIHGLSAAAGRGVALTPSADLFLHALYQVQHIYAFPSSTES